MVSPMSNDVRMYNMHRIAPSSIKWVLMLEEYMADKLEMMVAGDMSMRTFATYAGAYLSSLGLPEKVASNIVAAYESKKVSEGYEGVFATSRHLQMIEDELDSFVTRRNTEDKGKHDPKD